jgi:hypothetical protein
MGRISRLKSTGLVGASAAATGRVALRVQTNDAEMSKAKNSLNFKILIPLSGGRAASDRLELGPFRCLSLYPPRPTIGQISVQVIARRVPR